VVDNKAGLAPKQFAKMMDKGEATVYRWIKNGYVKAVRIGPRLLIIPMGEVERILREN
jgi:predicted site-specific integrase-resolvase